MALKMQWPRTALPDVLYEFHPPSKHLSDDGWLCFYVKRCQMYVCYCCDLFQRSECVYPTIRKSATKPVFVSASLRGKKTTTTLSLVWENNINITYILLLLQVYMMMVTRILVMTLSLELLLFYCFCLGKYWMESRVLPPPPPLILLLLPVLSAVFKEGESSVYRFYRMKIVFLYCYIRHSCCYYFKELIMIFKEAESRCRTPLLWITQLLTT